MVWKSANRSETIIVVLSEYGWEIYNEFYMPVCTAEEIAPGDLISLVSCSCNGDCSNAHCTCKKNNVACTDFCECGDSCENTDTRPPERLGTDEEQEEEGAEEEAEEEDNEEEAEEVEEEEEEEENEDELGEDGVE